MMYEKNTSTAIIIGPFPVLPEVFASSSKLPGTNDSHGRKTWKVLPVLVSQTPLHIAQMRHMARRNIKI